MITLSQINYKTWEFIEAYRRQFGYTPTITEIAAAFAVAQSVIWRRLNKLQAAGWITRERYKSRSIVVIYPSEVRAA